ncbi:DUF3303 family protein [Bdellovibrio sp. BCCA]|uniref:DUF3303 family protein n=1 Tax=Bdellovibrio sp. BCCA TaxID=3136281 RepID=UPI0030F1E5C8
MHFLAKITIPTEGGNKFVSSKNFNERMDDLMSGLKPEAAYFCVADGHRTIFALVNLDSAADIPRAIEPFWLAMGANVDLIPAMTQAEFGKAMPGLKQSVEKYGKSMTT